MRFKLKQLKVLDYGDDSSGVPRSFQVESIDIQKAINEDRLEKRNFQDDILELIKEWNENSKNYDEYFENFKKYHIERIAYLVVSDLWRHPIEVRPDMTIKDGQHRYWAAIYLNQTEIEGSFSYK